MLYEVITQQGGRQERTESDSGHICLRVRGSFLIISDVRARPRLTPSKLPTTILYGRPNDINPEVGAKKRSGLAANQNDGFGIEEK